MATITAAESQARAFAAQFPTANVALAIGHAEAGRITWQQVADLFARSLAVGLASVSA